MSYPDPSTYFGIYYRFNIIIITKCADSVNIVPSDVTSEMYVRAKTTEAIKDANMKVDRSLKAGAMGVGASVEITTTAGYLPLENNHKLSDLWMANAAELIGEKNISYLGPFGGSTDMGDLTHLKPGIHPMVGAFPSKATVSPKSGNNPVNSVTISLNISLIRST